MITLSREFPEIVNVQYPLSDQIWGEKLVLLMSYFSDEIWPVRALSLQESVHQNIYFISTMFLLRVQPSPGYQTHKQLAISHKRTHIKDNVRITSKRSARIGPQQAGRTRIFISCGWGWAGEDEAITGSHRQVYLVDRRHHIGLRSFGSKCPVI